MINNKSAVAILSKLVAGLVIAIVFCSMNVHAEKKLFNHSSTGFELVGAHNGLACENCHIGGQFDGTPKQCAGCHSLNGRFNATPQPPNHIATTQQCEACHQPIAWQGAVLIDHSEVIGPCFQCHNNLIMSGQPADHFLVATKNCNDCHSELSWVPANMQHDQVLGACVSCHNGVRTIGQPPAHINTQPVCDGCHRYENSFKQVFTVDHDLVVGVCTSCHNGVTARGQFEGHRDTGKTDTSPGTECDVCHFTNSFTPQRFEF